MVALGRERFEAACDVSRETLTQLDAYAVLLEKWNPKINLVSKSTLPDLWVRHFLDSEQVWKLAGRGDGRWVDLGSGGGFPGIVAAILSKGSGRNFSFVLVEADKRKSAFLRSVAHQLDLPVDVQSKRIEELEPLAADILTARALAPLPKLLSYAERHLDRGGVALLQKGANYRSELAETLEKWVFQSEVYPSITDGSAVVLKLGDIKRV